MNLSFNFSNITVLPDTINNLREDQFIRDYCAKNSRAIFITFALIWLATLTLQICANRDWITQTQYIEYSDRLHRGSLFFGAIALVYLGLSSF